MCQFTIATVKCAPLMFCCCLRVITKLLFIIAGCFHVMLCVIISLIKSSKLSKILVYNSKFFANKEVLQLQNFLKATIINYKFLHHLFRILSKKQKVYRLYYLFFSTFKAL